MGVSRTTVNRWDRSGIEGPNAEAIEFARRYAEGRDQRAGAQHRAGSINRFTPDKRAALLILIATGRTLAQACDEVGVSSVTVQAWNARGRAEHDQDTTEFAALYLAALAARPAPPPDPQMSIAASGSEAITPVNAVIPGPAGPQPRRPSARRAALSQERLIELLERQADRGVVGAIKLLLERPWEKKRDQGDAEPLDPFDDAPFDDGAPVDLGRERERRTDASP